MNFSNNIEKYRHLSESGIKNILYIYTIINGVFMDIICFMNKYTKINKFIFFKFRVGYHT
ncbi:MAG: hypothetical protein ACI8WT_004233 [Clostridium sp.]|jgi:hypothetical protein